MMVAEDILSSKESPIKSARSFILSNVALQKRIAFWCVVAVPILLAIISVVYPNYGMFRSFGNWALGVLIFVMFLTPVKVLTKSKLLMRLGMFRREFALVAFWFFFFHAAGVIYTNKLFSISNYSGFSNYLFWGAIAAVCMVVLGITSNNFSVRVMRKNWKRVQYVSYVAFVAALLHVGFIRGGRNLGTYIFIAALYVVLKIAQLWAQKNARSTTKSADV